MIHSKLTTWLWRHLHNCLLKIMINYQFEVENMINQLVGLLKNSKIHIELHFKLFIRIKNGLKNEMIKLNVNFFFVKP